jgi:hypothetical protein
MWPQVAREIKLHINLNHASIIAMYAAWKDKQYVYLALEWAPGVGGRSSRPSRSVVHDCYYKLIGFEVILASCSPLL